MKLPDAEESFFEISELSRCARIVPVPASTRNVCASFICTKLLTMILMRCRDRSAEITFIRPEPSFRIPDALMVALPSEFVYALVKPMFRRVRPSRYHTDEVGSDSVFFEPSATIRRPFSSAI